MFVTTFDVFATPDKMILSHKCDHEGLRRAEIFRIDGNAVTNPSLHVSVHLDCDNYEERKNEKLIFTVDNGSLNDNDLKIDWTTFDTLTIEYKTGLRIINKLDKGAYPDSTLNFYVIYKETE